MKLVNLVVNIGAIAICFGTTLALQLPQLSKRIVGQTPEADQKWVEQEKTRLNFVRQLPRSGFGFNNLIADATFLGFLQYFGDDQARINNKTGFGLSPDYFQVIVDRDPRFVYTYIYLSTSISIFAGQAEKAIALYSQGLESLSPEKEPYAYTVWRRKAVDQLLFLGDVKGARQSYLKAAEWAERANFGANDLQEVKYIAQWSRASAEALSGNVDIRRAKVAAWGLVLAAAVDRKTFEIATNELAKLGITVEVDARGEVKLIGK